MAEKMPEWLKKVTLDKGLKTQEDYADAAQKYLKNGECDKYIRHAVKAMVMRPVNRNILSTNLWQIANQLNYGKLDNKLLTAFLGFTDELPRSSEYYHEGRFERGEILETERKYDEALHIYLAQLQDPLPSEIYHLAVLRKIANCYYKLKKELDFKNDSDLAKIPTIPSLTDLGKKFGYAIRGNDIIASQEETSKIMESARWIPSYVFEANDILKLYSQYFAKNHKNEINNFRIQLLKSFSFEEKNLMKKKSLNLASIYLNQRDYKNARKICITYYKI